MTSEVFLEDCLKGMARYPDKFFDLAIVDPPYGIGEGNKRNKTRSSYTGFGDKKKWVQAKDYGGGEWDHEPPKPEYFAELLRVSRNQIIWGANHFGNLAPASCWIVWDKDNGECDQADCELAWTSFSTTVRKFRYRWHGLLQENMKDKEERIHPTHKPTALYKWLLKNYAKPGDKILDTHLGSQSSRIAAYDMGFAFTGFEIDKDYFEAGNKRFENFKKQLKLF
jgi:site-specific DNA-methyltransferase (adenine-specific)